MEFEEVRKRINISLIDFSYSKILFPVILDDLAKRVKGKVERIEGLALIKPVVILNEGVLGFEYMTACDYPLLFHVLNKMAEIIFDDRIARCLFCKKWFARRRNNHIYCDKLCRFKARNWRRK